MASVKKAVILAVWSIGAVCLTLGVSAPANADPADDPCQLGVTFLCHFLPIAPDLDHDIDLTQDPASINGQPLPEMPAAGPLPDGAPPAAICDHGCN